jgi:hypothetical protein
VASNLEWRTEGRLHVCVHGSRNPTNVEWQRYLNASNEIASLADCRIVILTRGGSPSGQQRQALMTAIGKRTRPVALLTDNSVARMAIFAMRVFNPAMKAFATKELRPAGDFLGLSSLERDRVAQLLAELERGIDDRHEGAPAKHDDAG